MNKLTIKKTLLVFLGLAMTSTTFAACSHSPKLKEAVSQIPAPQTITTFASEKSDK